MVFSFSTFLEKVEQKSQAGKVNAYVPMDPWCQLNQQFRDRKHRDKMLTVRY
jgi:hypothetical protein